MKWNWKQVDISLPYIVVGIFATLIIAINFPWHGALIGWDNLTTEMNPAMNFWRNFSGVWQEYQGLGLLAGMAHASDLVRLLIQWFLSLLIPEQFLRAGMLLSMLLIGSLGMVKLFKTLSCDEEYGIWGATLAGLFYLLNIGTVQNFWAVFEPYAWAFGFVPWLCASLILYLRNGSKRNLISLAIVCLLATPMAYIQTIFLIYFLLICVISVGWIMTRRDIGVAKKMERVFVGSFTILMVNSFWLLPQVYFTLTSLSVTVNAKMNLIATPEVELSNQARGNLFDVIKMRGYWLDLHDTDRDGGFYYLMDPWVINLQQNWVLALENIVIGLLFVGIVTLFLKKNEYRWSILLYLIVVIGILQNNNEPLGWSWIGLYDFLPILRQIFRSSFTKVVVFQSLLYSVLLGFSLVGLLTMMRRIRFLSLWTVRIFVFSAITIVIVGLSYPIFKNNLLYKSVKLSLPAEYKNLNAFFDKRPSERILKLPTQTLWGWQYNNWGYDGSGFLWYGIEQPILDRAFDVWSPYNEGFYNEFSTSLYGGSNERVSQVLDKYDVRYVLLDESVIAPGQDKEILRIEETKRIAEELGWEQKFKEGFLTVWETDFGQNDKFVGAPDEYTLVDVDSSKVRNDVAYQLIGTYVSIDKVRQSLSFPFSQLMREEVEQVEWGDDGVRIKQQFAASSKNMELVIPGWEVGEIVRVDYKDDEAIPTYFVNGVPGPRFLGKEVPKEGESHIFAKVGEGEEWEEYRQEQKFEIMSEELEIEVRGEPFVYDFATQGQGSIGNCDVLKRGVATKTESSYYADSRGAVCDYVVMELPFTRLPYLLRLRGENYEGRSIKFFLYNTGSKRNDIEYLLGKNKFDQTFTLLPWEWDGYYTLNIETRSFGQVARNRIDPVVGQYVPLDKFASAMLVAPQQADNLRIKNDLDITYVKKTGTWLYGVGSRGAGLLRLSQGYDEGWVGIMVDSEAIKLTKLEHVKVDGWANGWILPQAQDKFDESQIVMIFYWPQLLQYLGFVLLGATLLVISIPKRAI